MAENKDLEVVIEAGKILMESGAEIFRVEETLRHMAHVMEIEDFDAYTVTGGIMSSGLNKDGERVSRVANVPKISIHLEKLEAVNALSRDLEKNGNPGTDVIEKKLDEIRHLKSCGVIAFLIAYFVGAGAFAYAMGSSAIDSLVSSIVGLVLGLVTYFAEKIVHTNFLVTIIGSIATTIAANVIVKLGFGQMRGLIILGAFMLIVPGAVFVNSVREFSENNYATGVSHLMSAFLTCISMAVGVASVSSFFPFADQMSESFAMAVSNPLEGCFRVIMAGLGTLSFAVLYNAPKKYYLDVSVLGSLSWLVYLLIWGFLHMEMLAVLVAAMTVTVGARILSVKRKCPMTMFLSTSIFPLFPGIVLYRGIYFLISGQYTGAYPYLKSSFMSAFMIAIAISFAKQLQFSGLKKNK